MYIHKQQVNKWKKGKNRPQGCRAEKAQGGQTKRQKQRPRQSLQLPDHMIADRCQGAAEEGCMQIRQSTGQK